VWIHSSKIKLKLEGQRFPLSIPTGFVDTDGQEQEDNRNGEIIYCGADVKDSVGEIGITGVNGDPVQNGSDEV